MANKYEGQIATLMTQVYETMERQRKIQKRGGMDEMAEWLNK